MFQSTRPRGARLFAFSAFSLLPVSIHAPAGGATFSATVRSATVSFNPRARGGRDTGSEAKRPQCQFQSTRPRGARLQLVPGLAALTVSIHAPAGGATKWETSSGRTPCFNPRARGGRDAFVGGVYGVALFQSTRPRGARPQLYDQGGNIVVSIHAPAGGATDDLACADLCYSFNPRARGGRDALLIRSLCQAAFQSTRPRGARHDSSGTKIPANVSIHAPAGGAT